MADYKEFQKLMCAIRDMKLAIEDISGGVVTTENGVVTSTVTSGSGTIAAGKWSVTVLNTGANAGTFNGSSLAAGQAVSVSGYYDNEAKVFKRLPSFAYNGTGTTFSIVIQD